jgi:hypothetical protein
MKHTLMIVLCSTAAILISGCGKPPTGTVASWSGGGDGSDRLGRNNGTLVNVTLTDDLAGQAFHFNGTNSFIQIPDSADLKPKNITVEAWVKFDVQETPNANSPGLQVIVLKLNSRDPRQGNFTGYSLCKNGNHFTFCIGSPGGEQVMADSKTVTQVGVWYHLAGTYDGKDLKLYVNGVQDGSAQAGFPLDVGTRPLFIGTSGEWFDGKLQGDVNGVTIYRRALSAGEIRSLYRTGGKGNS